MSPSCAAFSPNNFVRTSIPFFADIVRHGNTSAVICRQLCVADHQAAVNRNDRTSDVRSCGQAQAERHMSDFFRKAISLQRGATLGENRLVLFRDRVGQRGANRSGTDAVDGYSLGTEIDRQRARESDDSRFGDRVGTVARSRAEAFGRRDVDDARRRRTCADAPARRGPSVVARSASPRWCDPRCDRNRRCRAESTC